MASYDFVKEERRDNAYYFHVHNREPGPGLIKICSYLPYPAKVWVNGHERAKQQAARAGITFAELANGFASCDDPAGLQTICGRFGSAQCRRSEDVTECNALAGHRITLSGGVVTRRKTVTVVRGDHAASDLARCMRHDSAPAGRHTGHTMIKRPVKYDSARYGEAYSRESVEVESDNG